MKNIFFVKFVVLATCQKTIHTKKCMFYVIFMWFFFTGVVLVQVKTTEKCIFDVICHVIFCIFSTAETMHYNNQCCHWGNLVHIYVVFQYSIIVEMIICRSSVSLFVLLLIFSSVFITVHEKHNFCQICTSVNILKNYTNTKIHVWCDILCDIRFFRTGETIHCSSWCHLQYCGQVFTACKFFSLDCQLLPTCL